MNFRTSHILILAAMSAAALTLVGCRDSKPPATTFLIPVEEPMPPVMAAGWLNDEPPEDLSGKVVVVDCFASWCQPCAREAPSLVNTWLKYRGEGVVFIGLTPEEDDRLPQIQEFIDQYGTNWPIAYGAQPTLEIMNVNELPTIAVVGKDGLVKWASGHPGSRERAIRDALDQEWTPPAEDDLSGPGEWRVVEEEDEVVEDEKEKDGEDEPEQAGKEGVRATDDALAD